jgi:hypothetical protein
LLTDFPYFAEHVLKIRTKTGATEPLRFNRAQRKIHEKLEEQRAKTGRVKAVVLKARQMGCSTLVAGRFYHRVSSQSGQQAYILAHEMPASDNLFTMVRRFHEHSPEALQPHLGTSNAREINFDRIDSGYKVATAATKGAGRSATVQFLHGSEVAYWEDAEGHLTGALQAVPDLPGTEVILESTANGIGNAFHALWQQAEAGQSDFVPIFTPWYWQEEYSRSVGPEFRLDAGEADYAAAYGLTFEQMAWRRAKIADLRDELRFKQEYPATPAEAFEQSGEDAFISPLAVARARKCTEAKSEGALVVGVDPARFGDDRTAIIRRRGRVAYAGETRQGIDTMQVAGWVGDIINREKPDWVFVDVGGLGAGVVDRLRERGYGNRLTAVNFGERATADERFFNKRAECWAGMRDWLNEPPVTIPDSDTLHADLAAPRYSYDSSSRVRLERKEDMRRRGLRSPDEGDALALTFAHPVATAAARAAEDEKKRQADQAFCRRFNAFLHSMSRL